jgi:hypothetical protein
MPKLNADFNFVAITENSPVFMEMPMGKYLDAQKTRLSVDIQAITPNLNIFLSTKLSKYYYLP